jgi:lysophospholipase L1-like esterase
MTKCCRALQGVLLMLIATFGAAPAARSDGPTPYPDPEDSGAWPGQGPIRVFPYMEDNRKGFWAARANDQGAVVFAGDSLIGGYNVREAFPGILVANRGIGGDVTRGLLFRLKEDVVDLNPQAVVLCIGTNDLSCHTDPGLAVANLDEMVAQLREANPKVPIVLLLIPPRDVPDAPIKEGALQELNDGIRALAEGRENITVVDVFTPMADDAGRPRPELFDARKIHPNAAGYAKWTGLIQPVFEKLGVH